MRFNLLRSHRVSIASHPSFNHTHICTDGKSYCTSVIFFSVHSKMANALMHYECTHWTGRVGYSIEGMCVCFSSLFFFFFWSSTLYEKGVLCWNYSIESRESSLQQCNRTRVVFMNILNDFSSMNHHGLYGYGWMDNVYKSVV